MEQSSKKWLLDQDQSDDDHTVIRGTLTEFIHHKEANERALNQYEMMPRYVMVACYMRNREYTSQVVRTPDTLTRCCRYLLKDVLPLAEKEPTAKLDVLEFVQNRLRAIRCQFHVQSHFDPDTYDTLVRFHLYQISVVGDTSELRTTMDTYVNQSFKELIKRPLLVLCMLLLESTTMGYLQALSKFTEEQLSQPHIQRAIRMANSVILNDFLSYFKLIAEADYFESSILHLFIDKMRILAVRTFAKAQLNLPLSYLQDFMFFDDAEAVLDYLESIGYSQLEDTRGKLSDSAADPTKILVPLKLPQANFKDELRDMTASARLGSKRAGRPIFELLTNA